LPHRIGGRSVLIEYFGVVLLVFLFGNGVGCENEVEERLFGNLGADAVQFVVFDVHECVPLVLLHALVKVFFRAELADLQLAVAIVVNQTQMQMVVFVEVAENSACVLVSDPEVDGARVLLLFESTYLNIVVVGQLLEETVVSGNTFVHVVVFFRQGNLHADRVWITVPARGLEVDVRQTVEVDCAPVEVVAQGVCLLRLVQLGLDCLLDLCQLFLGIGRATRLRV